MGHPRDLHLDKAQEREASAGQHNLHGNATMPSSFTAGSRSNGNSSLTQYQ